MSGTECVAGALFALATPTPADADALARVHTEGWWHAYGELLPPRFYDESVLDRRRAFWSDLLASPSPDQIAEHVRAVRDSRGDIAGFLLCGKSEEANAPTDLEVQAVYVLPHLYGTGAAQAMLSDAIGDAPAYLWVARDNRRAQRFYEKTGFVADGTEQVYEELSGLRVIRMVRGAA